MKYVLILWLAGYDGFLDKQYIYLPHEECHILQEVFEDMVPHNKRSERTQIREIYFHGYDKTFLAFESCTKVN